MLIYNTITEIETTIQEKANLFKDKDFYSERHYNTGNFAKLHKFNLTYINSLMD